MTWTSTQMPPKNVAVEHTTREPGSFINGDHTNGSHKTITIQWQELFAIIAAAMTWGHLWDQNRICFHYNQAIALAWQGKSSKQPKLMTLLRKSFFTAAQNNFTVTIKHLPGTKNSIADAISRMQFQRFFSLAPQANRDPTPIPGELSTL